MSSYESRETPSRALLGLMQVAEGMCRETHMAAG